MAKQTLVTIGSLILLGAGITVGHADEMLLYTPKPETSGVAPASPRDGVLVRTVTVKRGDTLSKLSRKHIGVADYFPQMLVFNSIRNPDLIHPGDKLLVPVRPGKSVKSRASRRPASAVAKKQASAPASEGQVKSGERELFQRAERAYLAHDYRDALNGFTKFLRTFPRSSFAADASLYRADCYLHLSGE
ncbi:LysM peptidoglycan-binding domain-containing protein [Geomonas terrae]|uniref:LysM peptidoglycan-binding domain-containing protein n=1 Tax=Geomonas terrae TaxID=2562681 RepID=A0A4S1CKC0_9BACT|nr:LysM peptidoglycan-binding domain-containing protein [Geomonas terrae]TGU73983.1 LysM peptidoglycan-binding domain-containing protein [Geomonas terrae]